MKHFVMTDDAVFDNLIFETRFGSHLYGTNTPESDEDFRGVCIPPYFVRENPFQNFEERVWDKGQDRTIYSLGKFFKLCTDCNPNIIELLFAPESAVVFTTYAWERIKENSDLFLSSKVRFTFTGYAYSQLERIKRHKKWMDHPIPEPLRKDFGLDEMPKFGYEKLLAILTSPPESIREEYIEYAKKEMQYRQASEEYKDFATWEKTRNPKRILLEKKFGYDTKHGMHLIRLLTEGEEILTTGKITLPRPDAEFLLEIRNGSYSYEEILEMAGDIKLKIESFPTNLPKSPDLDKILELYYNLL